MLNKTILLFFILGSISITAYSEGEDEESKVVAPSATNAPVEPLAVQENLPVANSETFSMKGSSEEDKNDCKARVQAYLDKQACMNRYRSAPVRTTRDGSPVTDSTDPANIVIRSPIRPEAFEKCGPDVKYPVDCPIQ